MFLYPRVLLSRVMFSEMELKAADCSLKVFKEPSDEALLGCRGTQTI